LADGIQLARVAAAVALATEGIHSLGTGRYAEAATYDVGEKVSGVVVTPEEVEIHVVARYPLVRPIPELAESLRERVSPEAGGRKTNVVVEDLEVAADENL
jgi:hypothetical protein